MEAEALVSDYLGRLEQAAQPLAADRRGELIAEVQDHIESALTEAGSRDEVTARNVLERLGAPEEIVAAETGGDGSPAATPPPTPVVERGGRWGTMDLAALLFLTVGAIFLPVVGPLIGIALVWMSTTWTTRQKLIATLIVVAVLVVPVIGLLSVGGGSGGAPTAP
ncbi:MAG TPA: hypothetical protein VFQ46_02130 [Candidatus Limnocylindria bacterium]|nr:hypothetical protein [Candidatus Limnocylindria bacterium]